MLADKKQLRSEGAANGNWDSKKITNSSSVKLYGNFIAKFKGNEHNSIIKKKKKNNRWIRLNFGETIFKFSLTKKWKKEALKHASTQNSIII